MSVIAGSTNFRTQTKSLAGSTKPRDNIIDGKVHLEELKVALANRTAILCSVKGFLVSINSTFMYENIDAFARLVIASRIVMPPTTTSLSGNTRAGGFRKSNVKHVSRRAEAKERGGQGVHEWSTVLALNWLPMHSTQLVDP